MRSLAKAAVACALIGTSLPGCTNFLTARAIDRFAEGLAAKDAAVIRTAASEDFNRKALRLPEAVDDFKILKLPAGKVKVVSVEDISEDEKIAHVQIGESKKGQAKKELEYKLRREPGSRDWVVDDILITQKNEAGHVTKSVTEQMDLLLTVREFLTAWDDGARATVLEGATEEFGGALAELPPPFLAQLTKKVMDTGRTRSFKPEARIQGGRAVVLLPRSAGQMLIELKLVEGRWLVNDVAVESTRAEEAVSSARKMALVVGRAVKFVTAYQADDRNALQPLATGSFYKNCLATADLSKAPLPGEHLLAGEFGYRPHKNRVDLLLGQGETTYMLSFIAPEAIDDTAAERGAEFLIDELTIYEQSGKQVKQLSSLFASQAVVDIYAEALQKRDRAKLQFLSTSDFNDRVWGRTSEAILQALPMAEVDAARPEVLSTSFQGPVTEVTVRQGTRAMTYVLRTSRGRTLVDDIRLPLVGRPQSLKENLSTLIPVYEFAYALHRQDMPEIRKSSSDGMNRIVWSQLPSVPDIGVDVVEPMFAPIQSIRYEDGRKIVRTGDEGWGAEVHLVIQGSRLLVQDVIVIQGPQPNHRVEFMSTVRRQIIDGFSQPGDVLPASAARPENERDFIQPL